MLSSSDQEQHPNYAAVLWNHAALLHTQVRAPKEGLVEHIAPPTDIGQHSDARGT